MANRKDDFDATYDKTVFEKREERWEHVTYNTELEILESVKRGDVEMVANRIRAIFPKHDGHLSNDPHRQAIYEFVATITLVTRFAVEGGMKAETAYSLSDAYIKFADHTANAHDVYAIYKKMLIDFSSRVRRAQNAQKRLSLPVVRCMEYIESNTHNKITLEDLGRAVQRNPAYLCVQVKQETGVALTDYINRQKVEEAKGLLRDNRLTISAIAATLAFCSQSYFAKIFKEITGETPKKYRVSHFAFCEHKLP